MPARQFGHLSRTLVLSRYVAHQKHDSQSIKIEAEPAGFDNRQISLPEVNYS